MSLLQPLRSSVRSDRRRGSVSVDPRDRHRRVNSDHAAAARNGSRAVSTASADQVRVVVRDACETASNGIWRRSSRWSSLRLHDGAENDARIRTVEIATAAEAQSTTRPTREVYFKPLKRTMSWLVVDRVMARRLPSRDQANDPMERLSVKRVSWRGAPPLSGCTHTFPSLGVCHASPVWRPGDGRIEQGGADPRGEEHPGRLQTRSEERPSAACAVKAIDPPSGETATLPPSVSFVGVPPSIGTIQMDTVPPTSETVEHGAIVGRDHALSEPVTVDTSWVIRRPLASAVQRSGLSLDVETNTIVRPSLVTAGVSGVGNDLFRRALTWRHPQDRRPAADKPSIEEPIARPREALEADRHTLHDVGARGRFAVAHPHIHPRVAPGGHEAAAIAVRLIPT